MVKKNTEKSGKEEKGVTDSQKASQVGIGEKSYKTQRYCNTVRVYKQFCQITGIKPDWHDENKEELDPYTPY